LNEEMTEHLGHEKNRVPDGLEAANVRNGTRSKTVLTESAGHVTIDAPRDRDGTFTPQIVKKRQRRLSGVDEIVLSLYAKGLTTGEIAAHFDQIYGASVSKETVSRIPPDYVQGGTPSAVNAGAARAALDELTDKWGKQYGAIVRLWESAWEEFIPFLDYDVEIRTVICSTNAIESLNARYRRAVRARGHFPTEQAALKCLYLVTRSLDPTGRGQTRWTMRWKPALNAFAITFSDRWPAAETY